MVFVVAYPKSSQIKITMVIEKEHSRRVGLDQLVIFLVVKLIHSDLNSRFDMCVAFTANYSFSGSRRLHRQRNALSDRLRESQEQADSVFQRYS
jgi:hypothetical protein